MTVATQAQRSQGSFASRFRTARPRGEKESPLDRRERFVVNTVCIGYATCVLLQKLAFVPYPGTALQWSLPLSYVFIGLLVLKGGMTIDPKKFLLYAVFTLLCAIASIYAGFEAKTVTSLFYLFFAYFLFTFNVNISSVAYGKIINFIIALGIFATFMVYMDWIVQLLGQEMPSVEKVVPKSLLFFNYVYIQPIEWGSKWMKPNGFFFLETSFVSQFIATALVLEACKRQRIIVLGILGTGLVLGFGGTGLLLIILSLPAFIFYLRPKLILVCIMVTPLLFAAAIQVGLTDNIEKRSSELSRPNSSGYNRFTVQAQQISGASNLAASEIIWGKGPGRAPQAPNIIWLPIVKVLLEYGLFVSVSFWFFFLGSIFGRGVPFYASWVVLMQYFFLNGSFLVPICVLVCLWIAGIYTVTPVGPPRQPFRQIRFPTRAKLRGFGVEQEIADGFGGPRRRPASPNPSGD